MMWLEKLPTLSTVIVLTVMFACLERQVRSATSRFWKIAWFLMFLHFAAQFLEPADGAVNPLLAIMDWGSLQMSAVAFVVSMARVAENRVRRNWLIFLLGLPSLTYVVLGSYDVKLSWPYVVCLFACFAGGIGFWFYIQKASTTSIALAIAVALVAIWSMRAALHGNIDAGATALLGFGFAMPGVLMCRNRWRMSPGVITIILGFLFWGAVFPLGMLTDRLFPQVHIPAEIWNIPKMWVAFGMVLTVIEDLRRKDQEQNVQMQRFSAITSQLLSGATVDSLCAEITRAITEVTPFQIAAIYLDDGSHALRIPSASGVTGEALIAMRENARNRSGEEIKDACAQGRMIGRNSFVVSSLEGMTCSPPAPSTKHESNSRWNTGDELLIPMRSGYETCLGCIVLREPRNPMDVNAAQLSRIELLAADLAVALELRSMQNQLVRADKLAALGRLVAGVAHELNNPLTAVIGYSELLGVEGSITTARAQGGKLLGEARRMQRIVENLLRFSRQAPKIRSTVDIATVLHEVLALQEYYRRPADLKIVVDMQPGMRSVIVNEDQLKQVLLNLFNNAVDAVQDSEREKKIIVRVFEQDGKAFIQLQDTGAGFSDVNRAFDPFYTTKPLGKGTGLGLSICYGIVKEHAGEIRAENLSDGARVTVELPLAEKLNSIPIELSFPAMYSTSVH